MYIRYRAAAASLVALLSTPALPAQTPAAPTNDALNPYTTVRNFSQLPAGRTWGSISTVEPDIDGRSIWIVDRCGANSCVGSMLPVVMKFDASGKLVRSFGEGLFVFPHGIHVDAGESGRVDGVGESTESGSQLPSRGEP